MSDKDKTTITIERTDKGFTIDFEGKSLDDLCCGCIPIIAGMTKGGAVCCEPKTEKKGDD